MGTALSEASEKSVFEELAEPKALFLFVDGLSPNYDEFMRGLRSKTQIEQTIPAIGGFAGDILPYKQTFQYCDDEVVSDGTVWALLSGAAQVHSVVSHGCVTLGEKHVVTKSDRNMVYEVDNLPVLQVIETYLTEAELKDWGSAAIMLAWGLDAQATRSGVDESEELTDEQPKEKIVRCMTIKDEETGGIMFFTEIEEGREFWISRRDAKEICKKSEEMAIALANKIGETVPKLIFQVECVGRGKLLMREQEKLNLLEGLQQKLGKDIPWIGLYAFAEIGPASGQNSFHNFTSVLAAIC